MRMDRLRIFPKQQGFLSIVAVLLIVAVAFIGVALTYMTVSSSSSTNNFAQSENVLYAASAGFEETARLLLTPNLSGSNARIACASITGNSNLTNTSFGSGTFTATTGSGSPYYVNTTLSSAITSTSSTIPVASTAGFAPAGRVIVDREIISYGGISGNSFVGIERGANVNNGRAHVSGAYVAQYQCNVVVNAGIPNLTSPLYQRQIQQSLQLQEGWAVGNLSGFNFELAHWNRPTEIVWSSSTLSSISAATLNAVSMLSNAEGWAVGNVVGSAFTLLHYAGSSWSLATSPTACSGQNLNGVSAVYHQEAWAVGVNYGGNGSCGGTKRYTVLYWNGTGWTELTPTSSIPIPADNNNNQTLNAVHVIDSNNDGKGDVGFAVGNSGTILQYNGSAWTKSSDHPTSNHLLDVYVVSASEAWAVGAGGVIIKWDGSSWSTVSSPTTTQLNGIVMLDTDLGGTANVGWAVGNSGVAVTYNGSSWSSKNTGSSSNLFEVRMFFTNPDQDVWAVGAAGTIMHYNGSAWSSVSSGTTVQLNSISLIAPQQYPFAWQEIFA